MVWIVIALVPMIVIAALVGGAVGEARGAKSSSSGIPNAAA